MKSLLPLTTLLLLFVTGCSSTKYNPMSKKLELSEIQGRWYLISGRSSTIQKGGHNIIQTFDVAKNQKSLQMITRYNQFGFGGEEKKIEHTAKIKDLGVNTRWTVTPMWPFKFEYIVLLKDPNKRWLVLGERKGNLLWIMARSPKLSSETQTKIVQDLKGQGYPVGEIRQVPQKHP